MRATISALFAASLVCVLRMVVAQDAANPLDILTRTLSKIESPETQANILRGMNASLKGRNGVAAPKGWAELYEKLKASPNADVRDLAQSLGAVFGSSAVFDEMRATLANPSAAVAARITAIESLSAAKDVRALAAILKLVKAASPLRATALRALAAYDDPQIAPMIVAAFGTFDSAEKREAFNTLLGRTAMARTLVAAVDVGKVKRAEITAPLARQLSNLHDAEVDAWLAKSWGAVKSSNAEKQQQIAKLKEFLSADLILRADVNHGRALFAQTCAVCHTLFGEGGKIGPELPGSFEDIDYLLTNIVDPNAIIGKDYQQTFITTKDGQVVSGIIASDDATAVTLKTLASEVTIQRANIAEMKVSEQSMMPEGLLNALDEQSVRDLFLYLRQKQQVPVKADDSPNGAVLEKARTQTASIAPRNTPAGWKISVDAEGKLSPGAESFGVSFNISEGVPLGRGDGPREADVKSGVTETAEPIVWREEARGAVLFRTEICEATRATERGEVLLAVARVRLTNTSDQAIATTLAAAITPEGPAAGRIYGLSFAKHAFTVEGRLALVAETPSKGAVLASGALEPRPFVPLQTTNTQSATGDCRGEMFFDLTLPAKGSASLGFLCPVRQRSASVALGVPTEARLDFLRTLKVDDIFAEAAAAK